MSSEKENVRWNAHIAAENRKELLRLESNMIWQAFTEEMENRPGRKIARTAKAWLKKHWPVCFVCAEIGYLAAVVAFATSHVVAAAATILGVAFIIGAAMKIE